MGDGMDIDPAIAAAMGFSGFGMQPGKKRKFDANDGFVDPETAASMEPKTAQGAQGKGANAMPLGDRRAMTMNGPEEAAAEKPSGGGAAEAQKQQRQQAFPTIGDQQRFTGPRVGSQGTANLRDLRHGVRNEQGDMMYFLPSFLEDPWKGLAPR